MAGWTQGQRDRRWRRRDAQRLADRAAYWAWEAEREPDPAKSDERRRMALMFATVARAMKEQG